VDRRVEVKTSKELGGSVGWSGLFAQLIWTRLGVVQNSDFCLSTLSFQRPTLKECFRPAGTNYRLFRTFTYTTKRVIWEKSSGT